MQSPLTIASRFRGPPDSGNGGYVAGAIASHLPNTAASADSAAVEVTLRAPTPLDVELTVESTSDKALKIVNAEGLIAEAAIAPLDLDIPAPPSFAAALAARENSPSFEDAINPLIPNGRGFHPICFCCGADVAQDEGLHVYAAPHEDFDGVAAAWRPHPGLASDTGHLPEPILWAALDCPGQFAYYATGILTGLLGRMTARVIKPVEAEQDIVITGWCIEVERSKHFAGTALFNQSGELCAYSKQVWIGRRN